MVCSTILINEAYHVTCAKLGVSLIKNCDNLVSLQPIKLKISSKRIKQCRTLALVHLLPLPHIFLDNPSDLFYPKHFFWLNPMVPTRVCVFLLCPITNATCERNSKIKYLEMRICVRNLNQLTKMSIAPKVAPTRLVIGASNQLQYDPDEPILGITRRGKVFKVNDVYKTCSVIK